MSSSNNITNTSGKKKLVVATRLHLGNAASSPDQTKMEQQVAGFAHFVATSCSSYISSCSSNDVQHDNDNNRDNKAVAVIAVDATPHVPGFDYVAAIQQACQTVAADIRPHVLPVTPWGRFVPALNALVSYATNECHADWILFVSAETTAPASSIATLCQHIMSDDNQNNVLVAGALLEGHDYQNSNNNINNNARSGGVVVELNGRTTPWNTMAIWNLSKLALTGFQLVSDGLLTDDDTEPSYGVEEVVAIALLQKLLGHDRAMAKLVKLNDNDSVEWNQTFQDQERQKWHDTKMKSKIERASRQLALTGLTGQVNHC